MVRIQIVIEISVRKCYHKLYGNNIVKHKFKIVSILNDAILYKLYHC